MKILLLIPTIAGFHAFLFGLARKLLDQGYEVHVATSGWTQSQDDDRFHHDQLTIHFLSMPRGSNVVGHITTAKVLNQLVDQIGPDIIQAHFTAATLTAALARRRDWPPTIAMIQGMVFPINKTGARRFWLRCIETFAYRRMDAVWVLTDDDYEELIKICGPEKSQLLNESMGFGCDLERFTSPTGSLKTELRSCRGLAEATFVFCYVGRQVAFKGYGITVRAFLDLYERYPNLRLLVVGGRDSNHPTGLTKDEQRRAAMCPGIVDVGWSDNVEQLLAIADSIVYPSEREGMPVSLMEALAMGVPAITCDTRGCRDIVRDGIDGIILKQRDVQHLASAMLEMVNKPDRKVQFSKRAIADRDRFDRKHFITANLNILRQWSWSSKSRCDLK